MEGEIIPVAALAVPVVGSIALFSFLGVASWSEARRKEREAYYRSETLKKIAETSGEGAKSAMELLLEQDRIAARRRLEGIKLGGLITSAVGIGMMIFLRAMERVEPAYLVGLLPLLVGAAMLIYVYAMAPKNPVNG